MRRALRWSISLTPIAALVGPSLRYPVHRVEDLRVATSSSSSSLPVTPLCVAKRFFASTDNHSTNASGTTSSTSSAGSGEAAAQTGPAKANKAKSKKLKRKRKNKVVKKKKIKKPSAKPSTPTGGKADSQSTSPKQNRKRIQKKKRKVTPKSTSSAKQSGLTNSPTSSNSGASGTTGGKSAAGESKKKMGKKLRVCVLNSSYKDSGSVTASVDNYLCTPAHYTKKSKKNYSFDNVEIEKADSFRRIRELVTSDKYDVFFNLCDGGRDEKRAGVDVVNALEEMNAAFTGTDSRSFEPSKIDMKLLVGSSGVKVPNFVLLQNAEGLAKKCRHLRFPVIVKHLSGYASVGIHKDNRCENFDQLKTKVHSFIKQFNHAMVEEFIRGREGTVLTCADSHSPFGVKVFQPLMFTFLDNADDFAYFSKKWTTEFDGKAYAFLPTSDPAYNKIVDMARNSYRYIMNNVGYGRVDFRIDEVTGEPFFLEINPNCGMWYSEEDGGDFADVMVQNDPNWDHEKFFINSVHRALKEQAARKPWYFISHDKNGQFSTRASRTVPAGKCLFGDATHPIPVVAKALFKLGEEEPSVGCVVQRGDGIHHAVAIRHSCEPNMTFVHGRTLLFAAKRQINSGEELTVDYATLRDESMPHFACSCGVQNCRSVIFSMPATPRMVEVKTLRKLLREKKRAWMQEKIDKEAELMVKKRSEKK